MSNYIEYWIYSYYSFLIEVMQSNFYKIFLWGMANCLQVNNVIERCHKKCWNSAMKEAELKKPNKINLHLSQGTPFWTEKSTERPGAVKINGSNTFAVKLKMLTKQPNQKRCMKQSSKSQRQQPPKCNQ